MLNWYRGQVNEHGLLAATGLLWRVGWSRTRATLVNNILPHRVLCPCCGWRAWEFSDYFEVGYKIPNSFCPQCESHDRHRELNLIWCHHVLEHIENDRAAIHEMFRVLRPTSGQLVVSVPMIPGTVTNEYGSPNSRESGHWRMYGDDFMDRLAETGFLVQPIDDHLSEADSKLYGISPGRFYVCQKPSGSHN